MEFLVIPMTAKTQKSGRLRADRRISTAYSTEESRMFINSGAILDDAGYDWLDVVYGLSSREALNQWLEGNPMSLVGCSRY
jgi:hypothetical protein